MEVSTPIVTLPFSRNEHTYFNGSLRRRGLYEGMEILIRTGCFSSDSDLCKVQVTGIKRVDDHEEQIETTPIVEIDGVQCYLIYKKEIDRGFFLRRFGENPEKDTQVYLKLATVRLARITSSATKRRNES